MGQQLSSTMELPQNTDRSLSFYAEPQSSRQNNIESRAMKTITVGSSEELDLLKQMFDFRLKNREYLTHCYGFQVVNMDQTIPFEKLGCRSPFLSIKINFHYEKITYKFSDLYQIPVEQGVKLLAHCLKGYSLLYDQFGYFTPEGRQINKQGNEWKVWISDNLFALKSRSESKVLKNKICKEKFLQQVVHLFDVLRDEINPQFSYSQFVYGRTKTGENVPTLQIVEILCKLNEIIHFDKENKNKRVSLRKISMSSSQTVRKAECNTLISFDQKTNDVTLSKFNNTRNKSFNNSFNQYSSVKASKQQNQNNSFTNDQSLLKKESLQRFRKNCYSSHIGESGFREANDFHDFKRVSSKLIKENMIDDSKENNCNHHMKNKSSASTPSNCTGWTKNMTPLKMLSTKLKDITTNNANFVKKERSYTMDLSNNNKYSNFQEQQMEEPRKITENSEVNSESEENEYQNNKNFDQAFLQSDQSIQQNEQSDKGGLVQIISKNPTSNTPSIANRTKKYGKQTMKLLKEYLMMNSSKGQHKRSLTDHSCVDEEQKRIKYCFSQEFDSEFFSMDSKKENPFASKLDANFETSPAKQESEQKSGSILYSKQEISQKKIKKVKISQANQLNQYSYKKDTDRICEKSDNQEQSHSSQQASINKLAIFKSEGGLKSLWGNNKLSTLKSIKQIEVEVPIDEEILNDLNKMFTRHRFAKSSKLTN